MQSAGRSSHELLAAVTVYYSVLQCVTVCYSVCGTAVDTCVLICPYPLVFLLFWIHFCFIPFLSFLESFVFLCPIPLSSLVPVMSSSISLCSDVFSSVCPLLSSSLCHSVFLLVHLRVPFSFGLFCSVHIYLVPSQPIRSCRLVLFCYLLYLHLLLSCPLQFCPLLFCLEGLSFVFFCLHLSCPLLICFFCPNSSLSFF